METIRNMTKNPILNKSKSKSDKNLDNLGLDEISDIEQLLSETNDELVKGYKLLNRLNKLDQSDLPNSNSESEPEEDILSKVSKAKTSNKTKQMIARVKVLKNLTLKALLS
jgi:hypothetical protein